MPRDLTILILASREGERILPTLESVRELGPIVAVVDDSALPETLAFLKEAKATIITRPFDHFAAQRNAGLNAITTEWVFVIDSDETVSPALRSELEQVLASPTPATGYEIPRENQVFGHILRHGDWYPDYQLRLFQTKRGRYVSPVHERLALEGEVRRLAHPLGHDNYRSISHYLEKLNRYTDIEAQVLDAAGKQFSLGYLIGKPLKEFWVRYVVQQGYRDGPVGLVAAWLKAVYRGVAIVKLWERHDQQARKAHADRG